MATTKLTLLDLAKRSGNDRSVGLVESMAQANALVERLPFRTIVGNSYRVKTRVGLPTASRRGFNQGIAASKSQIIQTTYETKIYESRSVVDEVEAMMYAEGVNALRNEEDASHIAAVGNLFASDVYYGAGSTNALQFDGLSTILSSTAVATVQAGTGASGSSTSIYFVSFADANTLQGRIRGVEGVQSMTLSAEDMGRELITDNGATNQFYGYVSKIQWMAGLAVYDTRSVGRYKSLTSAIAPTAANIDAIIDQMFPFSPDVILVNKTGKTLLKGLKSTIYYQAQDTELKKGILTYDGIPILIDENITNTE
jgi:hypothetical protein